MLGSKSHRVTLSLASRAREFGPLVISITENSFRRGFAHQRIVQMHLRNFLCNQWRETSSSKGQVGDEA